MVDSWKRKKWYRVVAPKFLGERELFEVPASEDEALLNRVIKIPLREISRDAAHSYTNVFLRVFEIRGNKAFTKFISHEVSRDYLSTQVRRRQDVLDMVFPVKSRDGVEFTIKAMVITAVKCSSRQKTVLRNELKKFLTDKAASQDFGSFILDALYGRTGVETKAYLRKLVAPLRRVEIRKTQLKEWFDTEEVLEQPSPEKEEREGPGPEQAEEQVEKPEQAEPETPPAKEEEQETAPEEASHEEKPESKAA